MMGFFDIFRKKEVPVEVKEISLKRFGEEAGALLKECDRLEGEVIDLAFRVKKEFYEGFIRKVGFLREVDLEKRKEDLRLKKRVLEGKESYAVYCEKLVEKILKLNKSTFEDYFRELSGLISRFEKDSTKSYSVANVLIGEELADVRKVIRDFFKINEKMFFDNKEVFFKRKYFKLLLEKYGSFKDSVKLRGDMENELKVIEDEIGDKRSLLRRKEKEFLIFKQSERFKNLLEKEKEKEKEKKSLFNQVEILKRQIDLKGLLGIYHKNEKMKTLLRSYKDNFVRALIEDTQNNFLEIFEKDLVVKLEGIRESLIGLDKKFSSEVVCEKNSFEESIEHILEEISSLETKRENSEKLLGKLRVREEEKLEELRSGLKKLDFRIKD